MSIVLRLGYLILTGCVALSAQAAPKVPIPDKIPGATTVDAEGVIDLAGKTPDLVMIDSRIEGDRKMGYIESSVSLPDIKTNCASLAKAVRSKDTPVLFYCNGVNCGRSVVAARVALKCGYTRVYWFRGGFEEWRSKRYPYLRR